MNEYTCTIKLKNPSPTYGCQERQVKIRSVTIHYAKKEMEFFYPDYKILKVKRENNGIRL